MFKKAFKSHKNSPTETQASQVRKLGMGGRGSDSETWRSNSTVVETVVLDNAIWSAVEKQSTEAASDNLQS